MAISSSLRTTAGVVSLLGLLHCALLVTLWVIPQSTLLVKLATSTVLVGGGLAGACLSQSAIPLTGKAALTFVLAGSAGLLVDSALGASIAKWAMLNSVAVYFWGAGLMFGSMALGGLQLRGWAGLLKRYRGSGSMR